MITVFTTPTCAYCQMVKTYLTRKGKEYKVVDLVENPEVRQSLFEKTGAMSVPITQVDDKFIIGWKPAEFGKIFA